MPNFVMHQINVLGSVLSSTLGLWRGTSVMATSVQAPAPEQLLKLYDMEGCPYCRAVREALTALHLDAEIYPCPKGGTRFRPEVIKLGGKAQFPYLVDPNADTRMYESEAIITYLFRTYGGREVPAYYRGVLLKQIGNSLGTAVRGLRGIQGRPARRPEQLLHLWSFESSPYSRLVRERLTELELPYVLHNVGKERWQEMGPAARRIQGGPFEPVPGGKRETHFRRTGHMQVPYLEDPNTGTQLLESTRILDYLDNTYAA